jgi:acetylornithine deacetylase
VSELLRATLEHLRALVAFDTRNPPRHIGADGIFAYLCGHLPGFELDLVDHGAGAVSLYARRGNPKTLFNVHVDTVPTRRIGVPVRSSCG